MYRIIYEINLEKTLKKIPKRDAQAILEKIEALAENPRPRWVEKLKGRPGYRIAVGNYRVIYYINDREIVIIVVDIDNRADVYKK
jgi:mRNA interferase RelE/StbE